MTGRGKIARLPAELREELNRRIRNGEPGTGLIEWLNGLPEMQAVLAAEFSGQPINETNLTNWRQGGYADWLAQKEALEEVREALGDANELSQAGGGPIADRLAVLVTGRYAIKLRKAAREGAD